ncbi:TetR/AcrR family transcriptional regulator [Streptomyces mirabilis]
MTPRRPAASGVATDPASNSIQETSVASVHKITEAAVRCFGRIGLERTSIDDITAESGLSTGSIYAHYNNKADLVRAAAREVLAQRRRRPGRRADLREATTDPAIRAIVVDALGPSAESAQTTVIPGCVNTRAGAARRPAVPGRAARTEGRTNTMPHGHSAVTRMLAGGRARPRTRSRSLTPLPPCGAHRPCRRPAVRAVGR